MRRPIRHILMQLLLILPLAACASDANRWVELGGKRYTVVERRFLLVPDRSGPLLRLLGGLHRLVCAERRGQRVDVSHDSRDLSA